MVARRERFLIRFFEVLRERHFRYVVLRNWEELPRNYPGSDIDILIERRDVLAVVRAAEDVCGEVGYTLWKKVSKNFDITHVSFVPLKDADPGSVVRVDLMTRLSWMGVKFLASEALFGCSREHNGVRVLPIPATIAVTVSNSILYNGAVKRKYIDEFRGHAQWDEEEIQSILGRALGDYGRAVFRTLMNGSVEKRVLLRCRRSLLWRHFWRVPEGLLKRLRVLAKRLASPPGDFIVLFGPDGSGKSTLAAQIEKRFEKLFYLGVARFHLFPRVIGLDARVSEKRRLKKIARSTHWELKQSRPALVVSMARLARLWVSFWIGYLVWVYPKVLRGQLVVGERWCFDLVYDPEGKGIHLPRWVRMIAFKTCPKPRLAFALLGSFETIASRQNDVPASDIATQLHLVQMMAKNGTHFVKVDATLPFEQVFTSVAGEILRVGTP